MGKENEWTWDVAAYSTWERIIGSYIYGIHKSFKSGKRMPTDVLCKSESFFVSAVVERETIYLFGGLMFLLAASHVCLHLRIRCW